MKKNLFKIFCIIASLFTILIFKPSYADLSSSPTWYDSNAVSITPDWHYRIPIIIPSGAPVNSTIKVDVDFNAILTQLDISGTFDINSPRIVKNNGALAAIQEFTDVIYNGVTDAAGNSRGEIRFITENAGPVTYYLYFDITQNGNKPVNPQTPINGNFEKSSSGTAQPAGWNAPVKANPNFDAQVRGSENPSISTDGTTVGNGADPKIVDGTPNTGNFSYLVGARTNNEPSSSNPAVTITKTFTVPSANAGTLNFKYRVQGWDSNVNNNTNYDYLEIAIVGSSTTIVVGPTLNNYTTQPFSPNYGTNQASILGSGYGQYNGWDNNTLNLHTNGMTLNRGAEPWFNVSANLAAFAGQTVTLRIRTRHTELYKSWFHIDDVEWSVYNATLGNPQAFGTNIVNPTNASVYVPAQTFIISAQVDAQATGGVFANLYDGNNLLVASNIRLYNDGTHGDATANDGLWTNNGSIAADPTYVFTSSSLNSNNWKVIVYAKDLSTSTINIATNGLINIPGQGTALSQANFYNIDEQIFTFSNKINYTNLKTLNVVNDPLNGTINPKAIPQAIVAYTIKISSEDTGLSDNNSIVIIDAIPNNMDLIVTDIGATGSGPVSFTNGTPSSTLTYSFLSLSNAGDDVSFSNDGGINYNYTPVISSNGTDSSVTHIRINPKGVMAAKTGINAPNFSVTFRARIN